MHRRFYRRGTPRSQGPESTLARIVSGSETVARERTPTCGTSAGTSRRAGPRTSPRRGPRRRRLPSPGPRAGRGRGRSMRRVPPSGRPVSSLNLDAASSSPVVASARAISKRGGEGRLATTSLRMTGNSANHSMEKRMSANADAFESSREASTTAAEVAALSDNADGKLSPTHRVQ